MHIVSVFWWLYENVAHETGTYATAGCRWQSVAKPGEDVGAAGDANVQRDAGERTQMYTHSHQDSVPAQSGRFTSPPVHLGGVFTSTCANCNPPLK